MRFHLAARCSLLAAMLHLAPLSAGDLPSPETMQDALLQVHAERVESLDAATYGRPLRVDSADAEGQVSGEVLAEMDLPLQALREVLEDPRRWCELLMLTPSIGGCASVDAGADAGLEVSLVRRYDEPADEGYTARFRFERIAASPVYAALRLHADEGPIGTSAYRIDIEVAAISAERSVLHLVYAYRYGVRVELAAHAYLATAGSDKLGFSRDAEGEFIGGMRGSVERTVMRYYLALEALARQSQGDPALRFAASLDAWLHAVAQFPRQLAEDDPPAYRAIKLKRFGGG